MEEQSIKAYEARLKHFPIMMYAVVMGLSGLSLVYLKAGLWLGFPKIIGFILVGIDTFIFAIISLMYLAKIFRYFEDVKWEFNHPVRVNFFAAFSISLLLLAAIYHELHFSFSIYLWYLGASIQAFMTFYCLSYWINKNMEAKHSNPAWLIPIVGNVIVPLGAVGQIGNEVLFYFFTVGIFFWIVLFSILLNRIIFHNQLIQKFVPTMFILIAPPAVGMVSYIKMGHEFDVFAAALYNLALFFSLLLAFMVKNFVKLKFFISWWAFTFPVAAMSIASMVAYHKTGALFYKLFSYIGVVFTTVIIFIVTFYTIRHILHKEICISE